MKLISRYLNNEDFRDRLLRLLVVGLPAVLIIISQAYVTTEVFTSMVTVTALIASLTPIARGGVFHNFKLAVLSDEKISKGIVVFIILTIFLGSQIFAFSLLLTAEELYFNASQWVIYTTISYFAFLIVVLAETYFYDYNARSQPWVLLIAVVLIICVAFILMLQLPGTWSQFSRVVAQMAGILIFTPFALRALGSRIDTTEGFKESISQKKIWTGIIIAIMLSMMGYIARSEVITGGADARDVLLANCLLVFGALKLLLFKELRAIEKHYLSSKIPMIWELLAIVGFSLFILLLSEMITFLTSDGSLYNKEEYIQHLRAFSFIITLCIATLVGGKFLILFDKSLTAIVGLSIALGISCIIVLYFPYFSFVTLLMVYFLSYSVTSKKEMV